jgi:hypothetical protein
MLSHCDLSLFSRQSARSALSSSDFRYVAQGNMVSDNVDCLLGRSQNTRLMPRRTRPQGQLLRRLPLPHQAALASLLPRGLTRPETSLLSRHTFAQHCAGLRAEMVSALAHRNADLAPMSVGTVQIPRSTSSGRKPGAQRRLDMTRQHGTDLRLDYPAWLYWPTNFVTQR